MPYYGPAYDDLLAGRFVDGDSAEEEMLRRLPQQRSHSCRGGSLGLRLRRAGRGPLCRLLAAIAKEADIAHGGADHGYR